jgi:hypothetical protein
MTKPTIEQVEQLNSWLESGKYLPDILQDFHDQKNLFKSIHFLYQDSESAGIMPSWKNGHIYTIDWFLYFMSSRGYTLQRSRKNLNFKEIPNYRNLTDQAAIISAVSE